MSSFFISEQRLPPSEEKCIMQIIRFVPFSLTDKFIRRCFSTQCGQMVNILFSIIVLLTQKRSKKKHVDF